MLIVYSGSIAAETFASMQYDEITYAYQYDKLHWLPAVQRLGKLQMARVSLKPGQRSSMEAIYNDHDVFVWLLTRYGKSLF